MIQIKITKRELALLQDHKKKAENNLIKDRAHCIILHKKGYKVEQIADILDRGEDTIADWLHAWEERRISSIFTNYEDNYLNNNNFTEEQLKEIKKTLSNPPKDKMNKFWSVKHLKNYLNANYSIVFESDRSYHHLLETHNYSFKLPEGFDKRRNDKLIDQRMLEIQGIIEKHKDTHEILFADECSLYFATEYKRAWLPKGETTVLKVNKSLQRQNYFGAWNTQTKQEHLIPLTWQNTGTIILALEELIKLYPNKKLMIIWDNAGWHKSAELKSHLGIGNKFENILLVNMPTYAPDHNPQEHIWKVGKKATQNKSPKTFKDVKKLFEESIQNQLFDYEIMSGKVGI
jgi:transposase